MNTNLEATPLGRSVRLLALAFLVAGIFAATSAGAAEFDKTYDFALDEWHEIDESDGLVTLHRIRIDRKEARITKSTLARPYNQEYLEAIRFQLEYSNGSSEKWSSRITISWLDEEGRVIDGFSANEAMGKKSARKINQASVSTLKYGLDRAKTLRVVVRYEP